MIPFIGNKCPDQTQRQNVDQRLPDGHGSRGPFAVNRAFQSAVVIVAQVCGHLTAPELFTLNGRIMWRVIYFNKAERKVGLNKYCPARTLFKGRDESEGTQEHQLLPGPVPPRKRAGDPPLGEGVRGAWCCPWVSPSDPVEP